MSNSNRFAHLPTAHNYQQPQLIWALIAAFLLISVGYLSSTAHLITFNRLIQDYIIAAHGIPTSPNIVIVAIDDASIAEEGRWPWRRTLHAELLDRISISQPKAIGLDVLFIEPDESHPQDDALLAAAIKRSGRVVLPAFIQMQGNHPRIVKPLETIAANAIGIGQAHIKVDNDGIVRNIFFKTKVNGTIFDHFSVALIKATNPAILDNELFKKSESRGHLKDGVQYIHESIIPYSGGPGHFERISFMNVINGNFSQDFFKDKFVLIGATATGIADQYATPMSGKSYLMPGIEILANTIDSLLHKKYIYPASKLQNILLNLFIVLLAVISFTLLSPLWALITTIVLATLLLLICYFSIGIAGLLFSPAAGLLALVVLYPVWSWQRLSNAVHYLTNQFESFQNEDGAAYFSTKKPVMSDLLDRKIAALEGATKQLQTFHRFVSDSIENIPYPTIISDLDGAVRIANVAALRYFDIEKNIGLRGILLPELVKEIVSIDSHLPLITSTTLELGLDDIQGEAIDIQGRELIVKCVPIMNIDRINMGWLLSIIDVSDMRQAERDREEAFRFITHDIRSPLSSIIALLQLKRLENSETDTRLLEKLEHHTEAALDLVDGFINLARAKSGEYHFEKLDVYALLSEALDDAWAQSHLKGITIVIESQTESTFALVDRLFLKRAFINLLNNAIKFSPDGSKIVCNISLAGGNLSIAISDNGIGMTQDQLPYLFQPYTRFHEKDYPEIQGSGLGLTFVHAVMRRHQGRVFVTSEIGIGSIFHLELARCH